MKKARNLAALLMAVVVFSSSAMAEDPADTLVVDKASYQDMVVEGSPILENLRLQRDNLMDQESKLNDAAEKIKAAYAQLPAYAQLEALYEANQAAAREAELSAEYVEYLGLLSKAASGLTEEEALRLGELTLLLAEGGVAPLITAEQYMQYTVLKNMFRAFGVYDPDLDPEKEYDIFIQPAYVMPRTLGLAVDNLILAIKATEAGLSDGAARIFDGVLFMEAMMALQEAGAELSGSSYEGIARKLELGLASEAAAATAQAEYRIAVLNKDSFGRDIENMKMNMNVMAAREVAAPIALEGSIVAISPSKGSVFDYVETALANRSEIRTIQNDMKAKSNELDYMEDYLDTSSARYRTARNEYERLMLQWEDARTTIRKDIYTAYRDMLLNQKGVALAQKELASAKEQYRQMTVNLEQGFINQDTLDAVGMKVIQAENAAVEAERDYYNTIVRLEQAAGIGPGYANGGMGQ